MRSRLGLLVIVGLLLGVLASCGGPKKLTEKTLFPTVSKAQQAAGSSNIAMVLSSANGQAFRSHGQLKLGKTPRDTAMAMSVASGTGGLGTVELRLVDRNFYIQLGALTKNKFAKIDLSDKSNPIAKQYGSIIENIDPAHQVNQYKDAITKFDASGAVVKIDGVKTQPYKITINPAKAAQLKDVQGLTLPKTITFTLYVGADNLPRRMVSKIPSSAGTTRMQMDYSGWGDNVVIKAPSKANIANDTLLSRLTG